MIVLACMLEHLDDTRCIACTEIQDGILLEKAFSMTSTWRDNITMVS